jgi:hypothetical protein
MNEIIHILTDPAHWVGEVVMDATFTLAAYPIAKWRVRAHDRRRHGVES